MDTELPSARQEPTHIVVLGGGLAGMSAAVHLLQRRFSVTLIERRPFLGGRAFSFKDPSTGIQVDNGQHVFLGCCKAYINFLKVLGVSDKAFLQRNLQVRVFGPNGKIGVLDSAPLPAPFHLLPSFLRYPHIGKWEKLKALQALLRIRFTARPKHPELQQQSFYTWLRKNGQSQKSIHCFWNLLILPTLNDDIRHVSADMGFMVFQESLLGSRNAGNIGYARVGLSELMADPATDYIQNLGGKLLLGHSAMELAVSKETVEGVVLANNQVVRGHAYISALPSTPLLEILPPALKDGSFFSQASTLDWAPIIDLHIWYDRPVATFDFAAFLDSPLQWVFNKSRIMNSKISGQYITVSLSGAWNYWERSKQDLLDEFKEALAKSLPGAREASIERFLVVKERRATFRSKPGALSHRLPAQTPLRNLFLAGDWIRTHGWPSTMEGAIQSGIQAADLAIARTSQ